jgi:hypothetical protein
MVTLLEYAEVCGEYGLLATWEDRCIGVARELMLLYRGGFPPRPRTLTIDSVPWLMVCGEDGMELADNLDRGD